MSNSSDQVSSSPKQLWWFFSQYSPAGTPAGDGIMAKNSPIRIEVVRPMLKAVTSYIEEIVGDDDTKVDPQDGWLPITESRNGNKYYAAFHTLSTGIGFQALLLPFAFTSLGWIWGISCLIMGFTWQMYTIWLLIQLHESQNGIRYSRYLPLAMAAFGEKLGKLLSLFPIMYLSGGTCVALIMFGSGSLKKFYETLCGPTSNSLSTVEWYMVFTSCAVLMAQLPNLNSLAFVSLIGSVSGVGYCSVIWVLSVCKDRPMNVSYGSTRAESEVFRVCEVVNAIGIIALAFRGHNLILEIQGTMPSNIKEPSKIAMWQGVKFAYVIIGMCLFPIAIGGYWAYGNLIIPTTNEGILEIMYKYHNHNTSKLVLCLTSLLIVIHCLSSFQVYAMPVFDNLEIRYTSCKERPCPRWLRSVIRAFFGCLTVFIAFAVPFLPKLAGLLGGIAMPITYVYPCFMWIKMKKPQQFSLMWGLNWVLGCVGILLSVLVVTGAIWYIVIHGIPVHFFKPQ